MPNETRDLSPLPQHQREPLRLSQSLLQFGAAQSAKPVVYDVVIVGSGYGGSVAAYQLARCQVAGAEGEQPGKLRVLVLERGREFRREDFPARFGELPRELRLARQNSAEVTGHGGLFDLRLGDDVNALVANGLGGGSLINAGVMLEPDPDALQDPHFAAHLRTVKAGGHFETARRWLGAKVKRGGQWQHNDIRRAGPLPIKLRAVAELAGPQAARLPPLTVALDAGPNFAQQQLPVCVHCGDCMTGCTTGAKDSLDRNLLARAAQEGATIVTEASVTSVRKAETRNGQPPPAPWLLRVAHTDPRLQLREEGLLHVFAHKVILAAGTLGSTEILLRSRDHGLQFSQRLGEKFSCNGDNIAAVQGLQAPVNGAADEDQDHDARHVGPTITATVPLQGLAPEPDEAADAPPRQPVRPFWLQEFSVPGPLKRLFEETVTTARTLHDLPTGDCGAHHGGQADPLAVDAATLGGTLLVGAIGHDDAGGSLGLADPTRGDTDVPTMGNLRIHWPAARKGQHLDDAHRALVQLAQADPQRTVVANPLWQLLPEGLAGLVSQPRGPVLTVHPLGGCAIGRHAGEGVVDTAGRVFDGSAPPVQPGEAAPVHAGLLVLDGAIVPCSLGANPGLTIAALAAHAIERLVQDEGRWRLPPDAATAPAPDDGTAAAASLPTLPVPLPALKPAPGAPPTPARTQVRITERLGGKVTLQDGQDYRVELTVAFVETAIAGLMGPQRVPMQVDTERSRLRLFSDQVWNDRHLAAASDEERRPYVVFKASLGGSMRFLHRADTGPWGRLWHGGSAWFLNRGLRDWWQGSRWGRPAGGARPEKARRGLGAIEKVKQAAKLATRAGERRLFDYTLHIHATLPLPTSPTAPDTEVQALHARLSALLKPGDRISGQKCITYGRRANPWTQLTQLQLQAFPASGLSVRRAAVLDLDTRFLAAQRSPLLKITQQRDQAEALAELLSLALYLFRVVLSTHLWTFRKPDSWSPADAAREPQRAPGVIQGLPEPEITALRVGVWPPGAPQAGQPLTVRLTRYARQHALDGRSPAEPLVFIHGYSVSGNTFTHPSLGDTSAVGWFWHQGRDVWVLDLRTSTALDSARWAWAMEDAALVDLPAALLHVRQLTGQRPDVFAHCIGCVMLSMALLTDAEAVRRGEQDLGVDTFLSAEQLGLLAAFNGPPREAGQPHPTVRRVVLSQKGPVLRYSDDNVMRAALMQYLRRWLLQGDYQFRASARPGLGEQLLDRLLASLPYPREDYDAENPWWPVGASRPWVGTRHRMDVLYGRDFNAHNMAPEVLHAIDDLFGAINLDTVSQTIHFVLRDAITNQRGRGEFVTQQRLKARWTGIPTFSMTGEDNGLVSPHTQVLLSRHLQAAGIAHRSWVPPGMGHQDVLIGLRREEVFDKVQAFFTQTPPPAPQAAVGTPVVFEPWVGPRLVAPVQAGAVPGRPVQPTVGAMLRPDRGEARLVLVPVQRPAPVPSPTTPTAPAAPAGAGVPAVEPAQWPLDPTLPWAASAPGRSDRWLMASPPLAPDVDWLAVLVYDADQVPFLGAAGAPGTRERGGPPADPDAFHPTPAVRAAVQQWWLARSPTAAAAVLVRRERLCRLQAIYTDAPALAAAPEAPPAPMALRFALGSCQYPAGLFDADPASLSLQAILSQAADSPPDFALFVGDQIYADATAGLVDPRRRDELYAVPHQRALDLAGLRQVMQQMPTHMLLDDHELVDNWEQLPLPSTDKSKLHTAGVQARRAALEQARKAGLAAFLRYQQMREGARHIAHGDSEFFCGGHAFRLLDTRSQRQRTPPRPRMPQGPDTPPRSPEPRPQLISEAQFTELETWLLRHAGRVKFIATPSALLPRHAASARDDEHHARTRPNAAASDAWCGQPAALARLLGFLLDQGIGRTVFLSGDEHHPFLAEITVSRGDGKSLQLLSVHSSALYAPFPFANGRPVDLQGDDDFELHPADGGLPLRVQVHTLAPGRRGDGKLAPDHRGDGVALLQIEGGNGPARLTVRFIGADGQTRGHWAGLV